MLRWSICLSPTNVSLDNRSELSQGMKILWELLQAKGLFYVRSMRHGRNESSNCHIKMLQLFLI